MEYHLDTAESLAISDTEIYDMLSRVFVDGGFAAPEAANTFFEPSAVRSRGKLIAARNKHDNKFSGMVIVVYPDSPARRLATGDETEMHLLAVRPEDRGQGLGRALVSAAVDAAKNSGYKKMLLVTQTTMQSAHRLYESAGFIRLPAQDFNRGGRDFLAYAKEL
jgi:ribosomal protein S18 acetylase RimI-like enzyme